MRAANAVGLLHEEMRRLGSLIMANGDPHQVPGRRRARGRSRRLLRRGDRGARSAIRSSPSSAARSPACRRRIGPASSSPPAPSPRLRWPRRSCRSPARTQLAFFDAIAPIVHRESIDMDVAWFQSRYDKVGPGGTGKDYINCPMDKRAIRRLRRRAARRRQDRLQGMGSRHALFRRLPADRGDGRARPRDAAPRADEAGRPHQPARSAR